jgi:hypothetical protein
VTRHARLALLVVAVVVAAVAHLALVRAASDGHATRRGTAASVMTSHQDSAVVSSGAVVRGGRALGQPHSVPLADVFAVAAVLALWLTASSRRRERSASAVVAYPRRGPPELLTVC